MKIFKLAEKFLVKIGDVLGAVFGTVMLTVVYFLVIGPLRLFSLLAGKDFLGRNKIAESYWIIPEKKNTESLEELQLPF